MWLTKEPTYNKHCQKKNNSLPGTELRPYYPRAVASIGEWRKVIFWGYRKKLVNNIFYLVLTHHNLYEIFWFSLTSWSTLPDYRKKFS